MGHKDEQLSKRGWECGSRVQQSCLRAESLEDNWAEEGTQQAEGRGGGPVWDQRDGFRQEAEISWSHATEGVKIDRIW